MNVGCILVAAGFAAMSCVAQAAPLVFSAAGVNAAAIQATVDTFRGALGNLNPNVAGSFGGGRREINWDGVPDGFAAPNNLPANFFNANSPRGVTFATPGVGFQVSANAGAGSPVEFDNLDPSYSGHFAPFSAQRLFTAIGSNVTDVYLFVPGSATSAFTRGFGVVFSDVDLPGTTSLSFFDVDNNLLGQFFASALPGDETFSFLGVYFNGGEQVARVRITSGSQALGPGSTVDNDLVAMDDFIYGEPLARVVPEPGVLALLALGVLAATRRRLR